MLKNKLYAYGDENNPKVSAHLNFGQQVLKNLVSYKDKVAIINSESNKSVTFGEMAQEIVDIALSLARIGVRKGDMVSICSENRLEYMSTVLGIICVGATFSIVNITLGKEIMRHITNLAKPKVMFCSPEGYAVLNTLDSVGSIQHYIMYGDEKIAGATLFKHFLTEHAPVEEFLPVPVEGWKDTVFLAYSSGTTGLPKGIPLTHMNLQLGVLNTHNESVYSNMRTLITWMWANCYLVYYSMICLYQGTTIVYSSRNDLYNFYEVIQKYKVTLLQAAPRLIIKMLKSSLWEHYDLSSLQHIATAGSPLSNEAVKALHKRFLGLQEASQQYGMTETGCLCSDAGSPKGVKPCSVGPPLPSFVLKCVLPVMTYGAETWTLTVGLVHRFKVAQRAMERVVDLTARKPLGPLQRGEIYCKSPFLLSGYSHAPIIKDEEGFFRTGDYGYYDDDRYFYILSRITDLINFNSILVAPSELEAVLVAHPAVHAVGVTGAPHETYQQVPVAFVELQHGAETTAEQLIAYVDTYVSPNMRLKGGVRFVSKLPYPPGSNKLDRKALKLMAQNNY